jgi:hypothetical protein
VVESGASRRELEVEEVASGDAEVVAGGKLQGVGGPVGDEI